MGRLFPRNLGEIIESASKPLWKKRGLGQLALWQRWGEIVGHEAAHYASPVKLHVPRSGQQAGTLTIACHPAYSPELQMLSTQIIEQINGYCGYHAVERLIITADYAWQPPIIQPNTTQTSSSQSAPMRHDDALEHALHLLAQARQQKDDKTS